MNISLEEETESLNKLKTKKTVKFLGLNAEVFQYIKKDLPKKAIDLIEQYQLKEACLIKDSNLECISFFEERHGMMEVFDIIDEQYLAQVNVMHLALFLEITEIVDYFI